MTPLAAGSGAICNDVKREYLERRRRECLEKAASCADACVAQVHREFAAHYATALQREPPTYRNDG